MGISEWESERRLCRAAGALQVQVPEDGKDSERVNVVDVMERRAYFPAAGVFTIWDRDEAVYVAATSQPLGVRLRLSVANHGLWTKGAFRSFTVSLCRGSQTRALQLRHQLKPKFNRRGYVVGVDDVSESVANWLSGESDRLLCSGETAAAEAVNRVRERLLTGRR